MKIIQHIIALLIISYFGGCSQIPSYDEYTNAWMGHPIDRIKRSVKEPNSYASSIDWEEKTYVLNNGNWVYIEPVRKGCFIHWEVNPQELIVGHKVVGEYCY